MESFKEIFAENKISYIIVQLPLELIDEQVILNEGQWVRSSKNGWSLRVCSEKPTSKEQRHVHIAKTKHINAKDKQASWNKDGTRHDKKSFNTDIGSNKIARQIARDALNLDTNVILEEKKLSEQMLIESTMPGSFAFPNHHWFFIVKKE